MWGGGGNSPDVGQERLPLGVPTPEMMPLADKGPGKVDEVLLERACFMCAVSPGKRGQLCGEDG